MHLPNKMANDKYDAEMMLEPVRQEILAEEMNWNHSNEGEMKPEWYDRLVARLFEIKNLKHWRCNPHVEGADPISPWYKKAVENRKDEMRKEIAEWWAAKEKEEIANTTILVSKCNTVPELFDTYKKRGGLFMFADSVHVFAARKAEILNQENS